MQARRPEHRVATLALALNESQRDLDSSRSTFHEGDEVVPASESIPSHDKADFLWFRFVLACPGPANYEFLRGHLHRLRCISTI
jgi:hypothetical protein